jgi:hypothetical protein
MVEVRGDTLTGGPYAIGMRGGGCQGGTVSRQSLPPIPLAPSNSDGESIDRAQQQDSSNPAPRGGSFAGAWPR